MICVDEKHHKRACRTASKTPQATEGLGNGGTVHVPLVRIPMFFV